MAAKTRLASLVVMAALSATSLLPAAVGADVVSIPSSRDNSIYQDHTTNSNGSGPLMSAGKVSTGSIRRAFVLFDVAGSAIPAGSTIDSVTVHFTIVNVPNTPPATALSLFRALNSWGEGASSSTTGQGAAAQPGDVTWLVRFYPNDPWTNPGADFDTTLHGIGPVTAALGTYDIPTTPLLVQDVQYWLDHPSADNYGWMIKADEGVGVTQSVRGIATREDATHYPVLEVHYSLPGAGAAPVGVHGLRLSVAPQPFRSTARLTFTLPGAAAVRLTVYDVFGRPAAVLADGADFAAGTHSLVWDGLTSGGQAAPAGLYWARLETPAAGSRTVKVLRLR